MVISLLGCGGGEPAGVLPVVVVTPARDTVTAGTEVNFAATVDGAANQQVDWRVQEGGQAGSIAASGEYTAGTTPGTYHLIAATRTTPESADTATVLVAAVPVVSISAPDTAMAGAPGLQASVPAQFGMTYQWSIAGGTLTGSSTTATTSFAAGSSGTLTLECTVTNPVGSSASASREIVILPAPPGPSIETWTASRARITFGQSVTLTPVFSGGTGSVNQGIGSVTSGDALTTGPLNQTTTFTLTITPTSGRPSSASLTVTAVAPPIIGQLDPISRVVGTGSPGYLLTAYTADEGGIVTIEPGVGSLPTVATNVVPTSPLSGTTTFTLSVRSSADSVVTDTATVMVQTPAPGDFVAAGSLGTPRLSFSATSLADGRLLILAGEGSNGPLRSAEIYDPASNTSSPAGEQAIEGSAHATVRLQDGRVLITSGTTAELYDPVTGAFTLTSNMTEPRSGHAMALLPDGRVLVIGGDIRGSSAELYDPSTGTFSPTGDMLTSRARFMTTPLLDGRVLVISGLSAEVYNPASGTFSSVGNMAAPHFDGTATLLSDGRVLVAGGTTDLGTPENAVAEVFDALTNQFVTTGSMGVPRHWHTATRRSDGSVLIAGGIHSRLGFVAACEVFDPQTDEFKPGAPLGTPRMWHAAAQTGSGVTVLGGGGSPSEPLLGSAERFQ